MTYLRRHLATNLGHFPRLNHMLDPGSSNSRQSQRLCKPHTHLSTNTRLHFSSPYLAIKSGIRSPVEPHTWIPGRATPRQSQCLSKAHTNLSRSNTDPHCPSPNFAMKSGIRSPVEPHTWLPGRATPSHSQCLADLTPTSTSQGQIPALIVFSAHLAKRCKS